MDSDSFIEKSFQLLISDDTENTLPEEIVDKTNDQLQPMLNSWHMPDFVYNQCKKHGIATSHLKKIENEEINILIPEEYLGIRIDFKHALKEWKELPFSTVASLNGAHMFCKSQGIKLQSTHTEDWILVWKDFEDTITLIVAGKGFTEKTLWNLLELIFGSLILFIGLEALKSQKSYDSMKREAKHYMPVIDKILDNCEEDLLSFSDCILASENVQILSKLNEFSTQFGSLFCSVVINQKLAVGTEGWWDLDVLDRKLLTTVLNTAGSLQKDIPVFLPRRSPNTAYRFVSVPITGTCTLCAICGAEPPYHEVKLLVSQTWRNDLEPLLNAEKCMPRNFPNSMEVDSNILGIILINKQYGKYVISRNLQQSASGKRTMSGSHRLDILRTFFHQAVDVIEDYLKDKTTSAGRKVDPPTVLESYWCSEYHKCHAYTDSAGNLMCALYVASVPTYTMRLITQTTLAMIIQDKTICWQ